MEARAAAAATLLKRGAMMVFSALLFIQRHLNSLERRQLTPCRTEMHLCCFFLGQRIGKQRQTRENRKLLKEEQPMSEQQVAMNDIQHLYFELFKRVRYNLLDGEQVVSDLLAWRELWYSVLPVRLAYLSPDYAARHHHSYTELSMLRTIRYGDYPFDTVYIWTTDQALPLLHSRIEKRWQASEMVVLSSETDEEIQFAHLDGKEDRVLFVWWD
jgi:hypothetical protein